MQFNESVAEALTEIVDELRATVARQELRLGEIEQGTLGQIEAVRNELRERIQHLLDEQRVCLRQISLRMGEEAALADRARRATDLRAEELAKKIAQP